MEMTADTIGVAAVSAAVFAMLWRLHRDIEALRRDMGVLRQDMHRGIGGLRQDMHKGIGGLRQDIAISAAECRGWSACWRAPA